MAGKPKEGKRVRGASRAAEDMKSLLETLERWQQMEKATVALTAKIAKGTDNVLVKTLMDIIQQDSKMHFKVQRVIVESLTAQAFHLTPEELGAMWELIDAHAQLEKQAIVHAEEALANCRLFPQRQLLQYLLDDERKHDRILGQLADLKRRIYPYA